MSLDISHTTYHDKHEVFAECKIANALTRYFRMNPALWTYHAIPPTCTYVHAISAMPTCGYEYV